MKSLMLNSYREVKTRSAAARPLPQPPPPSHLPFLSSIPLTLFGTYLLKEAVLDLENIKMSKTLFLAFMHSLILCE